MLLDFNNIYEKYNLNVKGVIHIGAHHGQEDYFYQNKKINNIMYFEPLSDNFRILESNVPKNRVLHNLALGNEEKNISMYVERVNRGMSSSILKPQLHLTQYPHIVFNEVEEVRMTKLDNVDFNRNDYNFINIDVQGYELEVFKGGYNFLNSIDYIMSEVNREELYKDCARIEQLDEFLSNYGFERVETYWAGGSWGDAFYIKNK